MGLEIEIRLQVIIGIAAFFFLLSIILLLVIFYQRIKNAKSLQNINSACNTFNFLISEFLFSEAEAETKLNFTLYHDPSLKNLPVKQKKQLLIDCLLNIIKNLNGESEEKLVGLYVKHQLFEESLSKLKSRKWHQIARGIRELSHMNYGKALPEIEKFIHYPQEVVSQEAQYTFIKLKVEEPFLFLQDPKTSLTLWHQICLHYLMMQKRGEDIPDFSRWLQMNNYCVVEFSLKMINYYKQAEARDEILTLLHHNNANIQLLAVKVLAGLEDARAAGALKAAFWQAPIKIKKAILTAIGEIGSEDDIMFITNNIDQFPEQLFFDGAIALKKLGSKGAIALEKYKAMETFGSAISHLEDPLL